MEYFVYLTNECNLNCDYCSVLVDGTTNNIPVKPNYKLDELTSFIIKMQNQLNDNNVSIYFFGGEPSLEYKSAENLVDKATKDLNHFNLTFVLHTNGLLLNEISDKLLNSISLILFSINYEKIPKYSLSNSYFSNIMNNSIKIKQRRNLPIIARLTITEKTSLYTEILQISHFYDLVYWQIENCFEFNDFKKFFDSYCYEIELTFSYWLKYLANGIMLKYVPFMSVLKFMFYPDRSTNHFSCGYGCNMVYIQTDGKCFTCSDSVGTGTHHVGNIIDGVTMPEYVLEDFKCSNCNYRYLCLGRCGRMHREFNSSHINQYCSMNKKMFDLFLKQKDELKDILDRYPAYKDELEHWLLEYTEFTP